MSELAKFEPQPRDLATPMTPVLGVEMVWDRKEQAYVANHLRPFHRRHSGAIAAAMAAAIALVYSVGAEAEEPKNPSVVSNSLESDTSVKPVAESQE